MRLRSETYKQIVGSFVTSTEWYSLGIVGEERLFPWLAAASSTLNIGYAAICMVTWQKSQDANRLKSTHPFVLAWETIWDAYACRSRSIDRHRGSRWFAVNWYVTYPTRAAQWTNTWSVQGDMGQTHSSVYLLELDASVRLCVNEVELFPGSEVVPLDRPQTTLSLSVPTSAN